jgi:hypothetical protein
MAFWAHYTTGGEILASGQATDGAEPAAPVGATRWVGDLQVSRFSHWFEAGQPAAYTEAQQSAKALRPGNYAVWSNATMSWSDSATLQQRRDAAWRQARRERDRRKSNGTYVASVGKWFHSDADSRIQQLGLVMLASAVPAVPWRTMDGSYVTMSQTLAAQIFAARVAADSALFAAADEVRAAIATAATPETVDRSAGLPPSYGDPT